MKFRTALLLVVVLAVVSGSGGTLAQTPRPNPAPSPEGPLPVTMTGDVLVNPGTRWPSANGAPSVWVAGESARTWSYKSLCLTGSPDGWSALADNGRDGWELVGQAGIACTQGAVTGMWFILKKPGGASK